MKVKCCFFYFFLFKNFLKINVKSKEKKKYNII